MDSDKGQDIKYELNEQLFIWNSIKAENNIKKHGITFEEAATVFMLDETEYYNDEEHSDDEEERFIAIGLSDKLNILMVCHCLREKETVTRIISARKTDENEQKRMRRKYNERFL